MISVLATAVVTPFMMADQSAAPVAAAQETPAAYNWATQNAQAVLTEDDATFGASGSFCFIPGGNGAQCVDDWHMC